MPGRWSKDFRHLPVRNSEFFGKNACLADYSHEVRIAVPPGYDVKVKMLADSRPGALPQVQSHIEPFRPIESLQSANAPLGEFHHLGYLCGLRFGEARRMGKRGDHEVTGCIGEQIQNYKIQGSPIQHQSIRITGSIFPYTKDARGGHFTH